jgi:hypothetical protein
MKNKIKNEGLVNNSNQPYNSKTPQIVGEFLLKMLKFDLQNHQNQVEVELKKRTPSYEKIGKCGIICEYLRNRIQSSEIYIELLYEGSQ